MASWSPGFNEFLIDPVKLAARESKGGRFSFRRLLRLAANYLDPVTIVEL